MNIRARALANLFRRGRITRAGLAQAVADGIITAGEYSQISREVLA